jgi:hypothetical protein
LQNLGQTALEQMYLITRGMRWVYKELGTRDNPQLPTQVRKIDLVFPAKDIQKASVTAMEHHKAGTSVNNYPHGFGNNKGTGKVIASEGQGRGNVLYEFPITRHQPYNGGNPGTMRVVNKVHPNGQHSFVGVIGHVKGNDFNHLKYDADEEEDFDQWKV